MRQASLTTCFVSPEEAIYVGDSEIDESAARAAGIPLVAYKNPLLSAAYHVTHFKEVEDLLRKNRTIDTG